MKRKLSVRVLALAVAGVVLSGAITVAAVNGSPYETLKRAIINVASYTNFTVEAEMLLTIDGETEAVSSGKVIITEDATLTLYTNESMLRTQFSEDEGLIEILTEDDSFSFESGNLSINPINFWLDEETPEEEWFTARVRLNDRNTGHSLFGGGMFFGDDIFSPENQNTAAFRFAEAALDLVVGDLRNQMSMHNENGIRHISGRINHSQLPEIIQAGIDVMVEENVNRHNRNVESGRGSRDDYWHPTSIPFRSFNFDLIEGRAEVDQAGNLLYIGGQVTASTISVFDERHVFDVQFSVRFSDIGTSVAESPIPGAVELFTPEFMETFSDSRWGTTVYFTLNDDGTINHDSITTDWPGNLQFNDAEFWDMEESWDWEDDMTHEEARELSLELAREAREAYERRQELIELYGEDAAIPDTSDDNELS